MCSSDLCVTGVDFSASSLAYAAEQAAAEGLSIDYQQADYLTWDTDQRFDLVTMIMCDFCVLSPERRRRLIESVARWLAPGGAFAFDAYTLAAFARRSESNGWRSLPADNFWSAEPCVELRSTLCYAEAAVVLDRYTLVTASSQRTVHVWHQYYDPAELVAELAEHGLRAEPLPGDLAGSDFDAGADEFAVMARRD